MSNYIDGFIFPLAKEHLAEYKKIAEQVAVIWKEYGAISYQEFSGDDMLLDGTRSFTDVLKLNEGDIAIFGWVVFPSKEVRNKANEQVPLDPRMEKLVAPLMDPERMIFNAERMVYGGFEGLVES